MDLKELRTSIGGELRGLDQRLAYLKECRVHIDALESIVCIPEKHQSETRFDDREIVEEPLKSQPATELETGIDSDCIRCLKCGSSLENLIPHRPDGTRNIGSLRLGKVENGERHLECPQCLAKNVFVRTISPSGSKLLITQVKP